jgi:hypothetical protein
MSNNHEIKDITPNSKYPASYFVPFGMQDFAFITKRHTISPSTFVFAFNSHGVYLSNFLEDPYFVNNGDFRMEVKDHLKKGVSAYPEPGAHGVMAGPYPGLLSQQALKIGAHVYILTVGRGYGVKDPAHPGKIRDIAIDIVGPQLPWHEQFKIPQGPRIKNMGPFHDAHIK